MSKLSESILSAIDVLAEKKIKASNFDKTVEASINKVVDVTIGAYDVDYKGNTYRAYASNLGQTYKQHQQVYVLIPGGNFNYTKTILGPKKRLAVSTVKESSNGHQYISNGYNNLINMQQTIALASRSAVSTRLNCAKLNGDKRAQVLDKTGIRNLAVSNYITVSCYVQTAFDANELNYSRGTYGLEFILEFYSPEQNKDIQKTYIFDCLNMSGDPYYFKTPAFQKYTFQIDGINFKRIVRIVAFCNNFVTEVDTLDKNNQPIKIISNYSNTPDIFFTKIGIESSAKIANNELDGISLNFQYSNGQTFKNNSSEDTKDGITSTDVVCQVLYDGVSINTDEQEVQFYWFKKNIKITKTSNGYVSFGGQGWQCLNSKNNKTSKDNTQAYLSDTNKKTFKINNNESKINYYKCVVKYNKKNIVKEFELYNSDAKYLMTFEFQNVPTGYKVREKNDNYLNVVFEKDKGQPILIATVTNISTQKEYTGGTWKWFCTDASGNSRNVEIDSGSTLDKGKFTKDQIGYTSLLNKLIHTYGKKSKITVDKLPLSLKNTINKILEKDNNNNQSISSVISFLQTYNKLTRTQTQAETNNTIYNVQIGAIEGFWTFYLVVTDNSGNIVSEGSVVIGNETNSNGGYQLVLNNAEQTFIYDENNTNSFPEKPETLSFKLLDRTGLEIDKDVISNISWKVPVQNALINISSLMNNYINNELSLLDEKYTYYNGDILEFDKNNSNFHEGFLNNNIELTVDYNGYKITKSTNFIFTKEGKSGTNGTGIVLNLIPKRNNEVINYYPCVNCTSKTIYQTGNANFDSVEVSFSDKNIQSTDTLTNNIVWKLESLNRTRIGEQETQTFNGKTFTIPQSFFNGKDFSGVRILTVQVKRSNIYYYASLPILRNIELAQNISSIELEKNSGYTQVIYQEDGTNPTYNNKIPFIIRTFDTAGNDISLLYPIGKNNITGSSDYFPSDKRSSNKNQVSIVPSNIYLDNTSLGAGITITVPNAGKIAIPIHFMINRFSHQNINGWDGNGVQMANNSILSPQVGAGVKDDFNRFTGIVMGSVQKSDGKDIGLFGYGEGERSIFLDASNGNATFGKPGTGQIEITPSSGTITGGSYKWEKDTGTGMQINLGKNPYIRFGSQKFSVDSEGNLTAKGGGSIAGWEIGNDALIKDNVGLSSNSNNHAFWAGSKNIASTASAPFYVNSDGTLHSTKGDIAGWEISLTSLTKGQVGISSDNISTEKDAAGNFIPQVAFWAGSTNKKKAPFRVDFDGNIVATAGKIGDFTLDSALYANKKSLRDPESTGGVYLGSNGISLGAYDENLKRCVFEVNSGGYLTAKSGKIANWNISNDAFYTDWKKEDGTTSKENPYQGQSDVPTPEQTNLEDNGLKDSLYFGSAGLALGKKFSINTEGRLYSIAGRIGGVGISDNGLWGGPNEDNPLWKIDGAGNAQFTGVNINGADLSGTLNNSGTLSGGSVDGAGFNNCTASPGNFKTGNGNQTWDEFIKLKVKNLIVEEGFEYDNHIVKLDNAVLLDLVDLETDGELERTVYSDNNVAIGKVKIPKYKLSKTWKGINYLGYSLGTINPS